MHLQLSYILRKCIVQCLLPFRLFPIRKNRILCISLEGGSQNEYSCNPKYFCEYLLENRPGDYEIVWLFRHPENYKFLKDKGIVIARHFTLRGLYYALTSRTVISNGGYFTWFPFRNGQLCVNTWHGGGAYKKLENDMDTANTITRRRMDFASRNINAYISSCKQFTEHVIRKAFLYKGTILCSGMPRNDLFFSEKRNFFYQKVRQDLGIPENGRILLYVPTFRSEADGAADFEKLNTNAVLRSLHQKTGEIWYFLNRSHIKAGEQTLVSHTDEHYLDVSQYPDTQELLCAADFMISDFSSIIWDYCLTERPLILYVPDLDTYIAHHGFYVDIHQWGFPLCQTMQQLLDTIMSVSDSACQQMSRSHKELLQSYEKGTACQLLLEYIEKNI